MTQRQITFTILAIVLVPLLIIVGYNALVVQPSLAETQAEGRGLNFPTEIQDLRVSGAAEFAKDLSVAGNITASSIVTDGAASLTSLNVSGATALDGGLTMDTSAFTVANTSGNTAIAGTLSVGGGYGSTGCSVSAAGVLQCNGAATIDGALAVGGNMTMSGFTIHSQGVITPTDGATITPNAEIVTLVPGGAVGVGLAACTTGTSTILYNSVNAAVVITDTGNAVLAGDQTLGQYDALGLVCVGTKWVQTSAVSAN